MTKKTNTIIHDFEGYVQNLSQNGCPDWVKSLRESSLDRFQQIGLPTQKDEEWKYTSIAPLTKKKFYLAEKGQLKEVDALAEYCQDDEINFVFVNGVFSKELSNAEKLPEGLTLQSLVEAFKTKSEKIHSIFNKYDQEEANPFVTLNNALVKEGTFIEVADKAVIKPLVHVVHVVSNTDQEICTNSRTIIHIGKSAEVNILESHISFDDKLIYFTNPLTDIVLEDNAHLVYTKAQKESIKSFHMGNTRVWQERDSNLLSISVMSGAAITRNNFDVTLNGEGANTTLDGLYSLYGDLHADNHTSVDHKVPNCTSNQLYKGILNDASRAVFNGKIFVKPIAQQTNSYQLNKNLLLGKDCRVDTKPQLEIFADDVKCTHGATIGQLHEDELFYLQARGISRKDAVKILAKGFVDELLDTVTHGSVNAKLHKILEPSFRRL